MKLLITQQINLFNLQLLLLSVILFGLAHLLLSLSLHFDIPTFSAVNSINQQLEEIIDLKWRLFNLFLAFLANLLELHHHVPNLLQMLMVRLVLQTQFGLQKVRVDLAGWLYWLAQLAATTRLKSLRLLHSVRLVNRHLLGLIFNRWIIF